MTTLQLIGGFVAATLPAVTALGCYSAGPTFDDYLTANGGTIDEICGQIGQMVSGQYNAGEIYETCLDDQSDTIHITLKVKCNNWWFSEYLNAEDAKSACLTEAGGCDHGSEQNHGDFWYQIDPNDGTC